MNFRNAGPSRPPHPPPACPRPRTPLPPHSQPIPPQTLPVCDFGGYNRPRATQQHAHPVENLEPWSGVLLTSPAFRIPLPPQSLLNRLRGCASRAAIAGYRPVRRLSMRSWKGIRCARSQRRTLCHTHSPLLIPPSTTPASVSDPARPLRPFQTASAASGTRSTTNRPAPKGACLACHPLDSPEVRRVKHLSPLSDAAQPVSACIQLPPVPPSRLAAPLSPRGGVGSRYGRALRLHLGSRPRSASAAGLPPSASASAAPAGAPSPPTSPSLPPLA